MTTKLRNWRLHGVYEESPLMAGVLPRYGVNFVVGDPGEARDAAIAHLATCVASTPATCAGNGRFGLSPSGSASGVAIVTSKDRAETIHQAIADAALARSVGRQLPIGALGIRGASAANLTSAHACIAELADWMRAEHSAELGLVILDIALPHKEALEFARAGRSVLVVANEAAAGADGVVISVEADRLAVGTAQREAAPVARKAKVAEPEPEITSRVALIVNRGEIPSTMRAKYNLQGFEVVERESDALPKPGEIKSGVRHILIAGHDQRPEELRARATRLHWAAVNIGVADAVKIEVAA
jgi:hypothetical protein